MAIGVVIVGVIAAVGAVVILMSSGGDSVPISAVVPTETPTPTETLAHTETPAPAPAFTPMPTYSVPNLYSTFPTTANADG